MAAHESGRVTGIYVTPQAGTLPQHAEKVRTAAGRGIEGDRYESGTGTYSKHPGGGRHLTLIAQEDLDAVARETGIRLQPAESRRNVLTTGIPLKELVGKRFWVGTTLCTGVRLCEPCSYLESKTRAGVLDAFLHRAGLRAEILEGGTITVGDAIRQAEEHAA
jgi:MOSC domain-containing protein YiiM